MGIRIQNNAANQKKYGLELDRNFTIHFEKQLSSDQIKSVLTAYYNVESAKKEKERKFCRQKDCCCDRFIKVQQEAFENVKRVYGVTYFSDTAYWGA